MPKLFKDYIGQTIGNRTVLRFSRFDSAKNPIWLVRCICGQESESLTQNLKRLECRNCRMRHTRKRPYESLYNTFVSKASKRCPVFIAYDDFLEFTEIKECHYCGANIQWLKWQTRPRNTRSKGQAYNLDRKNNDLPYLKGNLVVCCARCNLAKNRDFTYEEWRQLGMVIRSWTE